MYRAALASTTLFDYDATQNRVKKQQTSLSSNISTFYVRDAQGNVLAVYEMNGSTVTWKEQHIYGSSRLGTVEPNVAWTSTPPTTPHFRANKVLNLGWHRYEITDHLGNVRSIINDRRSITNPGNSSTQYYTATILHGNDYFPFGAEMRGSIVSGSKYRYGFNGKELDKNGEFGSLNHYDYGFRIYNPGIGRFLSVDPLTQKYPELTPYQFASNTPIQFIDLDGLEKATPEEQTKATEMINRFSENPLTPTAWSKIPKSDFVRDLTYMVQNSWSIDQSSTNLCGPAVACKISIDHDPESFVSNAINLYIHGEVESIKAGVSNIRANPQLLDQTPSNGLNSAEFILMTSIRHSFNIMLPYDPKTDWGLTGFTWPTDVSKFVTGFHHITASKSSHIGNFGERLSAAGMVSAGLQKGYSVAGLVDVDHLMYGKAALGGVLGNHFVQFNKLEWNSANQVTPHYWTWGNQLDFKSPQSLPNFDSAVKGVYLFW